MDIKAPEHLMPASRVLYRALMEDKSSFWSEFVEDYLSKADKEFNGGLADRWSKPLANEYKRMKDEKILGDKGQILNPQAFVSSEFFKNGQCRPLGLRAQILADTKEFKRLAQQNPDTISKSNSGHGK